MSALPHPTRSRIAAWLARGLGVLAGLAAAVLCFEVGLRIARPDLLEAAGRVAALAPGSPLHPANGLFVLDPELVYRPGPDNPTFGPHGAVANNYPPEKAAGVRRVLLVGDSVVQRELVTQAFRDAAGDAPLEFWSLGVEGYDTFQELELYRRYGSALGPDHVVLFYSFNDTARTPILFYDERGDLIQFRSNAPRTLDPRLLRWSYLYRFAIAAPPRPRDHERALAELMRPMRELRDLVEASGARFSVLVQPYLLVPGFVEAELEANMYAQHERNLAVMRAAGITAVDLAGVVRRAIEAGTTLSEAPGDVHHPSPELSAAYAAWCLHDTEWGAANFPELQGE